MSDALQTLLQTALLQRPRPWRIVGDGVVEDANGQEVCTVDTQRNLDDDVAAALAQLIAGAPILEAGATLRHRDGRTGAFVSVEDDGRYRVQSLEGSGFWIFHPNDCDRVSAGPAPAAPQAAGVGEDERLTISHAISTFAMLDVLTHSDPCIAAGAAFDLADRILALSAPSREPEGGAVDAFDRIHRLAVEFNPDIQDIDDTLSEINQIALSALATRKEAPADHISDARQMVEAPAEAGAVTQAENPGGYLIKDFADGLFWTPHRIAAVAALTDGHAVYDLRAQPQAREDVQPVTCERCYRGEVFGLSMDDGFWVEFSSAAGGAHPTGMNGWLELAEHHPNGRVVLREYIAKDSPIYPAPDALRETFEDIKSAADSFRDCEGDEVAHQVIIRCDQALAALQAEQGAK